MLSSRTGPGKGSRYSRQQQPVAYSSPTAHQLFKNDSPTARLPRASNKQQQLSRAARGFLTSRAFWEAPYASLEKHRRSLLAHRLSPPTRPSSASSLCRFTNKASLASRSPRLHHAACAKSDAGCALYSPGI